MKDAITTIIQCFTPKKIRVLDFVDRCCCHYTPILLVMLVFITGTIDIYGKPINCMLPQEFSASWSQYVHQYCYVTGTYMKFGYDRAAEGNVPRKVFVDYYQWVPFMLLLQLLIMRLPNFIWRHGQTQADVDYINMHDICTKIRNGEAEKRLEHINEAANYIYKVAKHRGYRGIGNKLVRFYALFKLMNILMVIFVIWILTNFVGKDSLTWGLNVAKETLYSTRMPLDLQHQPFMHFPRVAYCEFGRDFLGLNDGEMLQETRCTLGANMLNEKVFLILYFWYHILLAMTIVNVVFYIYPYINQLYAQSVVRELLTMVNRADVFGETMQRVSTNDKEMDRFSRQILGQDGLLLFHFLAHNCGRLVTMEVCSRLYHLDKEKEKEQQSQSPPSTTKTTVVVLNKSTELKTSPLKSVKSMT